jgi:hypothetical protein
VDYLRRIAAEIDSLSTMPSRFPFWKTSKKYRFLTTEKYLAFFQIDGMKVKVSYSLRRAKAVSRISLEHDRHLRGDF